MSYAAREPSNSFHLLRLAQPLFQSHALGNILRQRGHAEYSSRLIDQRRVVPLTRDDAAVLGDVVVLADVAGSAFLLQQSLPDLVYVLAELRMNNKAAMLPESFLPRVAEDALG